MSEGSTPRHESLRRALRRLLRPLVRFLVAQQLTYPALDEILRSLYVEVADTDYRLPGKEPSASRAALLTGIHRREVKRLREIAEQGEPASDAVSLSARLVADWNALPRFTDASGRPLPLNRSSRRPGPSLRDLAETAGQDIRPQAILDEWLRLGVVDVDEEGRIHLRSGSFVAETGFEEKAEFFGRTVGAHLQAASENLQGADPPRFDQVVYYGGLRPESVRRLANRARTLGLRALREWNREAARLQAADDGAEEARERIQFGAYAAWERDEVPEDAGD